MVASRQQTGDGDPDSGEFEPDYRFTLANERTFLAWQRTALGLLAGAVAVVHLVPPTPIPALRHIIGGLLAVLAVLLCLAGLHRWHQVDRATRRGLPLPRHRLPTWFGLGLAIAGGLCLVLVASGAIQI